MAKGGDFELFRFAHAGMCKLFEETYRVLDPARYLLAYYDADDRLRADASVGRWIEDLDRLIRAGNQDPL